MTRRDLLPPLLFFFIAALGVATTTFADRVFLPRHRAAATPGAPDEAPLPYRARLSAEERAAIDAEPFNYAMTDPVNLLGPDRAFAARARADGREPLWNPDLLCGAPHAANPIAAVYYPPKLLVAAFAPRDPALVGAALALALAAALFYLWLRGLGVLPLSATCGAAAFALSGWFSGRLFNDVVVDVVVWAPLAFFGVDRVLEGRRLLGVGGLSIATCCALLAGFPQLAVLTLLAVGLYAAVGCVARLRAPGSAARAALVLLLSVVFGAALSGPVLLPALELRRTSDRGRDGASVGAVLPVGAAAGLLTPRLFGGPYDRTYAFPEMESDRDHAARRAGARLVLGRRDPSGVAHVAEDSPSVSELSIFPGGAALLFCLFGLFGAAYGRARPTLGILLGLLLGLAFAFGFARPPPSFAAASGLDVGAPMRGVVVLSWSVPAFAAFALDRLLRAETRVFVRVVEIVCVAPLLLGAFATLAPGAFDLGAATLLRDLGAERALGLPEGGAVETYAEALRPLFKRLRFDLAIFGATALGAIIALEIFRRRPKLGAAALLVVFSADLAAYFSTCVRPIHATDAAPTTPALSFLKDALGPYRFARVAANDAEALSDVHRLFPPNYGLLHGLADAQGYREPAPSATLAYFRGLASATTTAGIAGFSLDAAGSAASDVAGVKFFVARRPLEGEAAFAASGLRRADVAPALEGDLVVYENPDVFPRAFLLKDADVAESRPTTRPSSLGASVAYERPSPETIVCRFDGDGPAVLVVSEAFDRGWTAEVDGGAARPPRRAFGAFLALDVDAGRKEVVFRYRPYGWREAGAASPYVLFGAVAVALTIVVFRRRRGPKAAA